MNWVLPVLVLYTHLSIHFALYMANHGPGPLAPRVLEYAEQFGIE